MGPLDSYGPWCGAPAAPTSRGSWPDILPIVIVSGYVTFYQINKYFVNTG